MSVLPAPPNTQSSAAPSAGRWARTRLRSRAWWITGAYALFATLWIYFSDHALQALPQEVQMSWSVYKGMGFVALTSVLLLMMMRGAFGAIEDGYVELKRHEVEIERLKRLYAALSQINQAIVWTPVRDELLGKICQALANFGGFRMAWIGWHDAQAGLLVPVAQAGDENGYLKTVRIYTADLPEGQGPFGAAFRENRSVICNALMHDPDTLPWRAEARRRGLKACAIFPIRVEGLVKGTLNVYAEEAGFFQDKEIALLEEAAVDISFGLENVAREEARRTAQALADAEKRFSDTMIESLPGILFFYDNRARFLRWNRNFERVSGFSATEIAARHPLDFFRAADRDRLRERMNEAMELGETQVEAEFITKSGQVIPYYFTGRRVLFGGVNCLVGIGLDVSERQAAEMALKKSEQRYRTTLDNVLEGCQLLDFDWRYLYLNPAAAIHNRRPNSELLGQRMQDQWPGITEIRIFSLFARCMEDRTPFHEETEFIFPDGSRGWFDVRVQPVPEGIFILSIDITERHKAETALRDLNEDLERKVAERTAELREALVRAESADRLKSAFLATMSHELRTPLNSIIGFTGIVLQGMAGPLNEEQKKQLGMVRSSGRHLLELINDVLDLSRIEAGQLEVRMETFDPRASLSRVVESVRPMAEGKAVTLTAQVPDSLPEMRSDRRRMEQILLNLLNNAIKFTDQGSILLTARVLPDFYPDPDQPPLAALQVEVSDTGIGLHPEDLETLFQPFRQVDNGLNREHEGTGLGLAICRRLATLMGGAIQVSSTFAQGSRFTVILPLHRPPAP